MICIYLTNATNTRLLNYIACINITAKSGIREKVLDQCKGNPNTKKVLQYSGFASHNLFGDLPEDYEKEYLLSGSHLYNSFVLQSKQWGEEKSFSSIGGRGKRSASSDFSTPVAKFLKSLSSQDNSSKSFVPAPPRSKPSTSRGNFQRGRGGQRGRGHQNFRNRGK